MAVLLDVWILSECFVSDFSIRLRIKLWSFNSSIVLQIYLHKFCSTLYQNELWHVNIVPHPTLLMLITLPFSYVKIHWYDGWLSVPSTGPILNTLLFGLARSGIHSSLLSVSVMISVPLIASLLTTIPFLFLLMILQYGTTRLALTPTNPHA